MQTITLPPFGATIPGQGGTLAAIMRGPDGASYALLITDQEVERCKWADKYVKIAGADSRTDGAANTAAMLAADCAAAKALAGLQSEGHADLFIPALGQLNAAAANVPELFSPEGVYWTSTQYGRVGAFVQDFESGGAYWTLKDDEFRVRAFRQIPLDLLTRG